MCSLMMPFVFDVDVGGGGAVMVLFWDWCRWV